MGTKVNSNYEDLLTFTRASKGHALRPVSYGAELVTNGTFDSDTSGWTAVDSATLSVFSNRLRVTNGAVAYGKASQEITTEVNKIYQVTLNSFDGTTSANPQIRIGTAQNGSDLLSATSINEGSHSFVFIASTTSSYINVNPGSNVSGEYAEFDNVSVKEVTFDQPDGTLTLFEHPVNVPRVEWDSAGNRLGLLVEEARTNSLLNSNDPSVWPTYTVTGTQNLTGPDKIANSAWTLEDSSITAYEQAIASFITISADTNTHTSSFFVKKDEDESRFPEFQMTMDGAGNFYLQLNTKTGATYSRNNGLSGTSSVEDYRDWWRVVMSAANDGTSTILRLKILPAVSTSLGDTVSPSVTGSIGFYGAQTELNASFPTSYIKTTGATATRSADVASIPVADFGWNNSVGTYLFEAERTYQDTNYFFDVSNSSGIDRVTVYGLSNAATGNYTNDNGFSANFAGPSIGTERVKYAVSFKDGDGAACSNGGSVVSHTSVNHPTKAPSTFYVGTRFNSTQHLNGHIKSIQYYPRRLTDAQLQALTEPRSTPTLSLTFDGLESSYTENYIHG